MNNTNNQKKPKFTTLDAIIIIALIGCVVGVVMRYNLIDKLFTSSKQYSACVSFSLTGVDPSLVDEINDEEYFYVVDSPNLAGLMINHESKNAKRIEANDEGEPVISYDSTLRDVTGAIRFDGVKNDEGFFIGGTLFVAPGKEFEIESKNVRLKVSVTNVDVEESKSDN